MILRALVTISVGILLSASLFGCTSSEPTLPSEDRVYEYVQTEQDKTFINNYEGYSYKIPDGFSVNTDFISLRLRLESENTVIEVYNEKESNPDSYIGYTNKAITASSELTLLNESKSSYDGRSVTEIAWTRDKLQRVENDRNHYLKFDIRADGSVYTVLVKSNSEITNADEYLANFKIVEKTEFDAEYVKSLDKPITATAKNRNEETEKAYNDLFKTDGLKWGLYSPAFSFDQPGLAEYEEKIEYKFPILLHYSGIMDKYNNRVTELLNKAYNDGGRYLELTLQPPLNDEPENMMYDVLDGKYDKFFADYAKAVKDFGHPVLLRLYNEMNGDWCEYSSYQMSVDTDLFKAAYNYTASFFEDAGNVIFIWNPNGKSFPDFDWNDQLMHLPDTKYVDVIGLTMYNTGNYYEGEEWMSFDELYEKLYTDLASRTEMPMMITEFASARAGGDKESWTRDMFERIKEYDKIKVAVWWNGRDLDTDGTVARAYFIDDSDEMIEIFRENLKK